MESEMKWYAKTVVGLAIWLVTYACLADTASSPIKVVVKPSAKQDLNALKQTVNDFLQTYALSYPGKVTVNVGAIDPYLKLAPCEDVQAFLPAGSRAWGKTMVGVRCTTPKAWTIYVQATLNVYGQYLVATNPLAKGQQIGTKDLAVETGDLTQLPVGVLTDQAQALGRTLNVSMNAGSVLRQDLLKVVAVVQQGQTVKLISSGEGFSVSADGQAVTKANEGELVRVKVASGQIVTGIARGDGQIQVGN
jgi:flagellar basal body P-ring formation protein FlgA